MLKTEEIKKTVVTLWELLRVKNGIIAFFGVLVGATFIYTTGNMVPGMKVFIAGFAALLITGAGNTLNDYFDFDIDRINKPGRPLPSGRISRSDAFMLSIVLFLLGLGFSKFVNEFCLNIAFLNSLILILYAKYSKRLLLVSNLGISFLVASIFVFGVAATIQDGVDVLNMAEMKLIAVITACAFLMTLSREITKDIEDMKGDERKYAITLPIKIGARRAKNMAAIFTLTAVAFSLLPLLIQLTFFNLYAYGLMVIIADLLFIISLTMHPSLGQRVMVFGMLLALLAFFLGSILPRLTL
jgi:geranylgeranylglycerol-phosphate geranylgeranyltransferase